MGCGWQAGIRDHADEDADAGLASDDNLHSNYETGAGGKSLDGLAGLWRRLPPDDDAGCRQRPRSAILTRMGIAFPIHASKASYREWSGWSGG
jgi:hypothetical protein